MLLFCTLQLFENYPEHYCSTILNASYTFSNIDHTLMNINLELAAAVCWLVLEAKTFRITANTFAKLFIMIEYEQPENKHYRILGGFE